MHGLLQSVTVPGAIDIVAIRHINGSIECSPFHVKLTNKGRDRSKLVQLRVNGQLTTVLMKLGPAGEAFFVERTCPPSMPVDSSTTKSVSREPQQPEDLSNVISEHVHIEDR